MRCAKAGKVGAGRAAAIAADQGDAGRDHARINPEADKRRLVAALALIITFMAGEVVVGILAHSLALLSDAAHMLTDAGAIGLSLVALALAARPAAGAMTYGLKRAEILSAQANGVTLLVLAGLIVYEAIHRLVEPPQVGGWAVLIVALVGVAVNLLATWQLAKANRENMAIEGSFQHIVTDLYAFIGTVIAAVIILTTGFVRADAIASLIVAALMLRAAYGLLKDSGRVLLEASPRGHESSRDRTSSRDLSGGEKRPRLHVWQIASLPSVLSACARLTRSGLPRDSARARRA